MDTCEIFRDCRTTIPLSSSLYTIACGFMDIQMSKLDLWAVQGFFPESGCILLITQRLLSMAQASSSFECLDTCVPAHATPTFVTEALHLVAYV